MSDAIKPLHVQVAEAIGWSAWQSKHGHWIVTDPDGGSHEDGFFFPVAKYDSETGERLRPRQWWDEVDSPRYDTDWSATGPLIERLKLLIAKTEWPYGHPLDGQTCWMAATGFGGTHGEHWIDDGINKPAYGATPLIAICNLILALKAAGKLEPIA